MTAVRRSGTGPQLDPDALAALEEQRDFLLASLDDLEREHVAGDLDDEDYASLHDDYTARAAEVLRALEDRRQAFTAARRPSSAARVIATVAGVALFSILAGVLVTHALGRRSTDESVSGGIRRTPSQEAKRCIGLIEPGGDPRPALGCFRKVLADDPRNPVALTYQGWTLNVTAMSGGLPPQDAQEFRTTAARLVQRGLDADPTYGDALAFAAIIALQQDRAIDAKAYLDRLDRSRPPAEITALIDQFGLRARVAGALGQAPSAPPAAGSGSAAPAPAPGATAAPDSTVPPTPGR